MELGLPLNKVIQDSPSIRARLQHNEDELDALAKWLDNLIKMIRTHLDESSSTSIISLIYIRDSGGSSKADYRHAVGSEPDIEGEESHGGHFGDGEGDTKIIPFDCISVNQRVEHKDDPTVSAISHQGFEGSEGGEETA